MAMGWRINKNAGKHRLCGRHFLRWTRLCFVPGKAIGQRLTGPIVKYVDIGLRESKPELLAWFGSHIGRSQRSDAGVPSYCCFRPIFQRKMKNGFCPELFVDGSFTLEISLILRLGDTKCGWPDSNREIGWISGGPDRR